MIKSGYIGRGMQLEFRHPSPNPSRPPSSVKCAPSPPNGATPAAPVPVVNPYCQGAIRAPSRAPRGGYAPGGFDSPAAAGTPTSSAAAQSAAPKTVPAPVRAGRLLGRRPVDRPRHDPERIVHRVAACQLLLVGQLRAGGLPATATAAFTVAFSSWPSPGSRCSSTPAPAAPAPSPARPAGDARTAC